MTKHLIGNIMLEDPNEKVVVACGHEKFNFKASQIGRYNASYEEKVLAKLFLITKLQGQPS